MAVKHGTPPHPDCVLPPYSPGLTSDEVQVAFNDDTRVLTLRGEHTETKQDPPVGSTSNRNVHRWELVSVEAF